MCSSNQKSEVDATNLSIIRGWDLQYVNRHAKEEWIGKEKKGNQHMKAGIGGEREIISREANANHDHRTKTNSTGRKRAPVTKFKMVQTIKRAFEVPLTAEATDTMKRIMKKQLDADDAEDAEEEEEGNAPRHTIMSSKEMRMEQQDVIVNAAIEKWKHKVDKGNKNVKIASTYKGKSGMDVPLHFRNVMKIKSFSRTVQVPYIKRELSVRHVSEEDINTCKNGIQALKELLQQTVGKEPIEYRAGHSHIEFAT